jgi:hypothetical protein
MSKPDRADLRGVTVMGQPTPRRPALKPTLVVAVASLAVVCSIVAVPSAAWSVPVPWKNCGSANSAISIQQIDASVWPPEAGDPFTVSYKLTLAETLTTGSREHLTTTLPSGGGSDLWVPFQQPVTALFSDALLPHYFPVQSKAPFLIPAGPYSQSLTLQVPAKGGQPAATTQQVGAELVGYDAAGRQVVCMQLTIPVKGQVPQSPK